ncbi:type II secretion system protein [Victivallis vadensis]|uniref:Type II secretion system protein n=1 Tax=Victivallis vadensis TaxID=172901 RepID=A0A848AXC9_9BACT|nr:type II secretion system protein [Victivallis vadensis]NMD85376.1 type II secretion system protein [Victivallis vadensis]
MKFSQKVVCGVLKNGNAPPIVHIRENSQQWKQAENDETVGPDMNKRTKRNFTLIELLVVMLLMGVLMTLMLPAFKRMISGNKVEQLASNLKLGLEQAQSHAITSRRYVALILPNPKMGNYSKDQWLGGCRLAYVNKKRAKYSTDPDTNKPVITKKIHWEFTGWVPDLTWREPIDGAMLLWILNEKADHGSSGSTGTKYNTFKAGQALADAPTQVSDVDLKHLIDLEKYDSTNDTATQAAIIFSPYGGIVGNPDASSSAESYGNLRLVIVEAIASNGRDGTLIYSSRDSNNHPTNYMVLEINRFTGRTKYYPLPED